jgi:hypothetical protein
VGTYPVVIAGGNDNNYDFTLQNGTITVMQTGQTITFNALADRTYGDASFTLSATASSGMAVAFTVVSGPASLNGNEITLTGPGMVVIRAAQAGNTNFGPAAELEQSFCVLPAKPVITSSGSTISSNHTAGNQWYLNGQAIAGATGQTQVAMVEGSYTVSVTGPCGAAVTSEDFPVTVSAIRPALSGEVVLYPNPVREQVMLDLPAGLVYRSVRIIDLRGIQVANQTGTKASRIVFPVHMLKKGTYLMEVQTNRGLIRKKFVVW